MRYATYIRVTSLSCQTVVLGACLMLVTVVPLTTHAATNLIPNPGLETGGTAGFPANWKKGGYGTNTRTLTYPVAGYAGARAIRTEITSYTNGDAKWFFDPVTVSGGTSYQFSDVFRSNVTSYVTVRFQLTNGAFKYTDIGILTPSTSWKPFTATIVAPAGAVSATVFHLIKAVGYVETDEYFLGTAVTSDPTKFDRGLVSINIDDGWKSTYENAIPILNAAGFRADSFIITDRLAPDDFPGYVKAADVLAMQASGHRIGAHAKSHPDLTTLSAADAKDEIVGSKLALEAIGVNPVNLFSYPYGAYNSSIVQTVKDAGFIGARSSDGGYNTKTQDRYVLRRQPMTNKTAFSDIQRYIDTAVANRSWVILLFHEVDRSGNAYAVTPELFQQTVDYLKSKSITPITINQGLDLMAP